MKKEIFDSMQWLGYVRTGVYLFPLNQHKVVDHYSVLDGNLRAVLYSSERYPLTLSVDVLRLFGSHSASHLDVRVVK